MPTTDANASSVISCSDNHFARMLMLHNMRSTNMNCQDSYSLSAVDCFFFLAQYEGMNRRHFLPEWRKFTGLSQMQVADRLEELSKDPRYINDKNAQSMGKTQGNLSKLESGKQTYDQITLEMLAEIYGTEPASLIMRNPLIKDAPRSILDGLPKHQLEAVANLVASFKKDGTNG